MNAMFVLGHRGAPERFLENTLESFRAAMALGADGVELDVRRTRDGRLVVHHDPCLPGQKVPIERSGFGDIRRRRLAGRHRVPTLREALASVSPGAQVIVELKGNVRASDVSRLLASEVEPRLGLRLSSFNHRMVASAAGTRYPFALTVGSLATDPVKKAIRLRAAELHLRHDLIDRGLVRRAHARGIPILAWTVNTVAEAERLLALEVDGIITDRLETILRSRNEKPTDTED